MSQPSLEAGEVQAGVAREEFRLPPGVPLAGYSRRDGKPSRGLHDPVGVRALVLTDADTTAALVSCDLLIVDEHLVDAVRRRLLARGLPEGLQLILAATHTHSGPGAYGRRFLEKVSMGHFDPQVFDAITEAVTRAVVQAYAQRAPIQMAYGTVSMEELVANRVDPGGIVDGELIVAAFSREGATHPLAVVVNFSAHPTTLGAWNRLLSADYPGVVSREVEERLPGSTCLFLAGSVGDQAPRKEGIEFERAAGVGRTLAEAVVAVVAGADPEPAGELQGVVEHLPLPPPHVRLGRVTLPRWMGRQLVDDDATLSLLAVGHALFIGVPCDLVAEFGHDLKTAARGRGWRPLIVGFANDYVGYCIPARLYETKQYESVMAFNGPQAGELIVNRLTQMVDQLVTSGQ